jgi:FkbM family methyltransferase
MHAQRSLQLGATPKPVMVEACFGPMMSFEADLITRQVQEFGAHTRPELAFLKSVLAEGDRVFDLGAHIGTFSVPLAQAVGDSGRVLALEGDPSHAALLRHNLHLNGLSWVDVAVSLLAPAGERYAPMRRQGNTAATYFAASADGEGVSCTSIDAQVNDLFHPDLIKLDVEGFEYWALSTSRYVTEQRPRLYFEVSELQLARQDHTIEGLDALLRELGYRFFRNVGPRNAAHDDFQPAEIAALAEGGAFFDVLALPDGDERIERVIQP